LSNKVNPNARNFDFYKRREKIFGTSDSNVFPLTAQLVNYNDWTAEAIMRRREQLTNLACDISRP
jgi:Protein of unknown function (DUF1524)